jgi:hypothetical protein
MAPMCLVRSTARWYRADSEVEVGFLPYKGQTSEPDWWEVFYAIDAHLLRGNWLCGGPLDFPEGSIAGRGSRLTFSVTGPFVEVIVGLGARPVAPPFRHRAPMRFLL